MESTIKKVSNKNRLVIDQSAKYIHFNYSMNFETYNVTGKFGENTKARTPDQSVEHKTNKNVIENGNLIVEQYDRHGKLIRKTPPG